jgi:hypothetical protein
MRKSGNRTFAKNLKRLKSKGAMAVKSNGTPLFLGSISNIPKGFSAEYTVKIKSRVNKYEISSI